MPMKLITALLSIVLAAIFVPVHSQTNRRSSTSYSIHTPARKYSYALVTKSGSNVSSWGEFDGSSFDSLRSKAKEDTLFVRKDGELYAITDRATVSQAAADVEPMETL